MLVIKGHSPSSLSFYAMKSIDLRVLSIEHVRAAGRMPARSPAIARVSLNCLNIGCFGPLALGQVLHPMLSLLNINVHS